MILALLTSGYFLLQNSRIQTFIIGKITYQLSEKTKANIRIGRVEFTFFNKLVLNNVLFADHNNDTILYTGFASVKIDSLKIRKRRFSISELTFNENKISVSRDSLHHYNFSFILDALQSNKDTVPHLWNIGCNEFRFQNSTVNYIDYVAADKHRVFIQQMNLNISDFINTKDSLVFTVNELRLNDGKNIFLEECSARYKATNKKIELSSLNLKTRNSDINNLNIILTYPEGVNTPDKNMDIDLQLSNSLVDFSELAELVPWLKGMKETVECSGHIYGNLSDLKGKDLTVRTGRNTNAIVDFYINDVGNPETMYLFLDLKKLETTFNDIERFTYPVKANVQPFKFPENFKEAGLLQFSGNFSGFISDFVTFGTLKSKLGTINTDLSLIPRENKAFQYNGRISTQDFQLGKLLNSDKVGNITFNGEVNGSYTISSKDIAGIFRGDIEKIEANRYVYQNIKLDGIYMDKMYDGMLSMNDSNLQFTFLGRVDLGSEIPEFDFNLHLERARLARLNLSDNFPKAEIAMNMKAKFQGDKLDNLKGAILVEDGYYKNRYGEFDLKGLQLLSVPNGEHSELEFTSGYFDIKIEGVYQFQNIAYAFQKNINQFLPSFNFKTPPDVQPNIFEFKINVKNIEEITRVFKPELKFETPFFLYGKMNSDDITFELEGSIPGIIYKDLMLKNIFIGNKIIDNHYSSKFNFGEIYYRKKIDVYDFSVSSEIANDVLLNTIEWKGEEEAIGYSTVKTRAYFTKNPSSVFPSVLVEFSPSDIYISDELWSYKGFYAKVDSSHIKIETFVMTNGKQEVTLKGNISKDSTEFIAINLNEINLEELTDNGENKRSLNGILNCNINVSDLYRTPVLIADIVVDSLQFEEQYVGNVFLTSWWDGANSVINSDLEILDNNWQSLTASGYYKPDSREISYQAIADSLPIKLLETVIRNHLSDFSGTASGKVKFSGTLDKIKMDGALRAANGGVKIDYTQVKYFLDDTVRFKTDTIWFKNITIHDKENNTGKFNGILVHDNFKNMLYDINISSPKILALNTTARNNEQFYGDAYANCQASIKGKGDVVRLEGTATSLPGTNINISMEYESDMQQYDFLEFVNSEESENDDYFFTRERETDFSIGLTVEATPEARVQLIYNSQVGDIIKGQGEGILLFEMNEDGDISLSGDYTVTKGDYLFTLQNVVNKRFTIATGGKIVWSGDPYNANIDISAIYKLKASVSDLLAGSYLTTDNLSQRIPVECIIILTDELINPTINFEIDFPDENEGVKNELQQFFNTDEEKNKQILSLIVLGKFYTPEYLRGQYESQNPNMIGTTASELFSNQLSNWLSQISSNVDVGFNYRPGNSITDDELELALSTQIFNDRVTLDGNIGNNVNPESNNSSQIVGDVDIRVKLVPSGKIQFKAFNHSNNNLIYETAPYTQGIGLSFKEEYNTFRELLYKIGSIFRKKDKSKS